MNIQQPRRSWTHRSKRLSRRTKLSCKLRLDSASEGCYLTLVFGGSGSQEERITIMQMALSQKGVSNHYDIAPPQPETSPDHVDAEEAGIHL